MESRNTQAKKKKSNRWWIWALLALFLGLMIYAYLKTENRPKGEKVTTEKSTKTHHSRRYLQVVKYS